MLIHIFFFCLWRKWFYLLIHVLLLIVKTAIVSSPLVTREWHQQSLFLTHYLKHPSILPLINLYYFAYRPIMTICLHACMLSHVQVFLTSRTAANEAPLSIQFSPKEHWSRLPYLPPRDPPNPGIKPTSPVSPALASGFFTTEPPGRPICLHGRAQNKFFKEESVFSY